MKLHLQASTVEIANLYDAQPFGIKPSNHAIELMAAFNNKNEPLIHVMHELVANAVDATHGQKDRSIHVHFSPNHFEVRDNGEGMSPDDIAQAIKIFESKRAQSNDYYGAFGIGLKTVFSLTNQFFIQTRKQGIQYTWSMEKKDSTSFPVANLLKQELTDEPSGTTVLVPVQHEEPSRMLQSINSNPKNIDSGRLVAPFDHTVPVELSFQNDKIIVQKKQWSDYLYKSFFDGPLLKIGARVFHVEFENVENTQQQYSQSLIEDYKYMVRLFYDDTPTSENPPIPQRTIGEIALRPGQHTISMNFDTYLKELCQPFMHLHDAGRENIINHWISEVPRSPIKQAAAILNITNDPTQLLAGLDSIKTIGQRIQHVEKYRDASEERRKEIATILWNHFPEISKQSYNATILWPTLTREVYEKLPELHSILPIPKDIDIAQLVQNEPTALGYSNKHGVQNRIPENAVIVFVQHRPGPRENVICCLDSMIPQKYIDKGYYQDEYYSSGGYSYQNLERVNLQRFNDLLSLDNKVPFFVNYDMYRNHPEYYTNVPTFEQWAAKHLTVTINEEDQKIAEVLYPAFDVESLVSYVTNLAVDPKSSKIKKNIDYTLSPLFDEVNHFCTVLETMQPGFDPDPLTMFSHYDSIAQHLPHGNLRANRLSAAHRKEMQRSISDMRPNTPRRYNLSTADRKRFDAFARKVLDQAIAPKKGKVPEYIGAAQRAWSTFQKEHRQALQQEPGAANTTPPFEL